MSGFHGPVAGKEFWRIKNLPRRPYRELPADLIDGMSQKLRKLDSSAELFEVQARALLEAYLGGGLHPIGVGHGKTLLSFLLPSIVRCDRPVLFVPSGLREKTHIALAAARQNWNIHPNLEIVGYSALSVAGGATLLEKLSPDLIVCDEVHMFRDKKSARTRRLLAYFKMHKAAFFGLSGTLIKRSPLDYWHLLKLSHGEEKMPLPSSWPELNHWAQALAVEPECAPGVLETFCADGEDLAEGFGRMIRETPGIVSSVNRGVGCSLTIRTINATLDPRISKACTTLEETWEAPGGEMAADALSFDRLMGMVSLGFYHNQIFENPADREPFMDARRAWAGFCRDVLRRRIPGVDSEFTIANEVDADRIEDEKGVLARWRALRGAKPKSIPVWFHHAWLINFVMRWLEDGPGIIWTRYLTPGAMLREALRIPFFESGMEEIETYRGSCIASIRAHGTGRNLQHFSRALVLTPGPDGVEWQQLLGRLHREGQGADEVRYDILSHTDWAKSKVESAKEHAIWLGKQAGEIQKLTHADWTASARSNKT